MSRRWFLALTAAICIAGPATAQQVTFKFGHAASSKHPFHTGVEMFAESVSQKTSGAVKIEVLGNRQLGDDRQLLEGVRLGTIDGALVSSVTFSLAANAPAFDALQLPFVVPSYEKLTSVLTGPVGQKLLDSLDARGMKGLGYYEAGLRHFLSSKGAVTTIGDFKGLKTRIVPVPLHKATWEAVGTNPIGLPYGEVYTGLQTKVIDAVEINMSSIETEKLFESAKDVTLTGHYFWPGVLVMNKARFEALPEATRAAIVAAGRETIARQIDFVAKDEARSIAALKAAGVKVHELKDLAKMREATHPVLETWTKRDPLIREFIDAVGSGS
jgi:tripartite ATP-independent transporter DctP family solute receptor